MSFFKKLFATPFPITLYRIFTYPYPYRVALARLWFTFFPQCRPHYFACIYEQAYLAKSLNQKEISVIEFGVAGGNGLVALENYAAKVKKQLGVSIQLFGFDMGNEGLPESRNPRDILYLWQRGDYKMDEEKLKNRLQSAELILGNISKTVKEFSTRDIPPIGAVFIDVDYYTSTVEILKLFSQIPELKVLPRICFYFDDVDVTNDFNGELLAIKEFNDQHPEMKIARVDSHHSDVMYGTFARHVFVLHHFQHKDYCTYISGGATNQLPLKD